MLRRPAKAAPLQHKRPSHYTFTTLTLSPTLSFSYPRNTQEFQKHLVTVPVKYHPSQFIHGQVLAQKRTLSSSCDLLTRDFTRYNGSPWVNTRISVRERRVYAPDP